MITGVTALLGAFALGRLSVTPPAPLSTYHSNTLGSATLVQNADPRELIPLPMPGGPDSGQQQAPGQPGQDQCPLYFFQDGQFFQLRPGESGPNGPLGQGNPELFPLDPLPPRVPTPGPRPGPQRPGQQAPVPRPPDQQQPPEPFFRAPGMVITPSPAPFQVAGTPVRPTDLGFLPGVSMSGLPGR